MKLSANMYMYGCRPIRSSISYHMNIELIQLFYVLVAKNFSIFMNSFLWFTLSCHLLNLSIPSLLTLKTTILPLHPSGYKKLVIIIIIQDRISLVFRLQNQIKR